MTVLTQEDKTCKHSTRGYRTVLIMEREREQEGEEREEREREQEGEERERLLS